MKELILSSGFIAYGAMIVEKMNKYAEILEQRRKDKRECDIEEKNIEKRIHFVDKNWVKSVITLAYPYTLYKDHHQIHRISSYALGRDYHLILGEAFEKICKELENKYEYKFEGLCDTTPILERAVALESGMGFQGKNGSIIIPKYGSAFYLGEIITDMEIDYETDNNYSCGDCDLCIRACPGRAITEEGIDANKCLSYITQKKGELTEKEGKLIGNRLFGCDTCQLVCPYNAEIIQERENQNPYIIEDLFNLSNREFKKKYGQYAASWRGKKILARNAKWNIKNYNS